MGNERNKFEKPFCERCKSNTVYVTVDGTVICRRCGYRNSNFTQKKKNKIEDDFPDGENDIEEFLDG